MHDYRPRKSWQPARRHLHGVTLIELMITIVIVALLAAIAYPSYQNQVQRTRRADGKAALLATAQRLERCYTRFSAYDDLGCPVVGALPDPSPDGFYIVSAAALTRSAFTLDATPQNAQTGDTRCGVLRLTSLGQQGSQGALTDTNGCW